MSRSQREVLEAAFKVVFGPPPSPVFNGESYKKWRDNATRFRRLLDAEAYTDAALMLVPEGWSWSIGEMRGIGKFCGWLNDHNTPDGLAVRHVDADAETPGLAICKASLRAKGPGHEQ